MTPLDTDLSLRRPAYCVLSARSLPYARLSLSSLAERCMDDLDLRLITDDESDRLALVEAVQSLRVSPRHRFTVHAQAELDELAHEQFAGLPNLQAFRLGHPCWRKITDPLLFARPGEELIILDPDLFFPNQFRFEPTPEQGILLMWQPPSCLLPDATVQRAYAAGIPLAHHVDIGVAHVRNRLDLAWLDWLIAQLGGVSIPRVMHVEAIVWAAMAMRFGGGYLDPGHWHCWRNAQWKRVAQKLRVPGETLLLVEPFDRIKCFHGGGAAKWWVPGFSAQGRLPKPTLIDEHRPPLPFEVLTSDTYQASQRLRRAARAVGYYRLFG